MPSTSAVFIGDTSGQTDSALPLQQLINQLYSLGGGTIIIPRGDYQMGSYRTAPGHPWKFTNLLVPSNVSLEGQPGTRLFQTDSGRGIVDVQVVETDVLAVGNPNTYQWIAFQPQTMYNANPVTENDTFVTATNPADAGNFKMGDLIGIYLYNTGDVIPSEFCEVINADSSSGRIDLNIQLARSFPTAFINKITNCDTHNVKISNLILEGTVPFAAQECFNVTVEDCHFRYQKPVGYNVVVGMLCNTVRNFRMSGGSVGPTVDNSYIAATELPQRNSANVTFENVIFTGSNYSTAEYPIHWRFEGCTFWFRGTESYAFLMQGWNMLAINNHFHCTGYNQPGGFCLGDYVSTQPSQLFGGIRYLDNAIYCDTQGSGNPAITSYIPGTQIKGNHLQLSSRTPGLMFHSGHFLCSGNYLTVSNAWYGIMLESWGGLDGGIVSNNFIRGSGSSSIGIGFPGDYARPGGYIISNNIFEGFTQGVDKSSLSTCHPGTIVVDNIGD